MQLLVISVYVESYKQIWIAVLKKYIMLSEMDGYIEDKDESYLETSGQFLLKVT